MLVAKRIFDCLFSSIGLIIISPIFMLLSLLIALDSQGGIFYKQVRIGKNMRPFKLFKFRTMYANSDKKGLLTVGDNDNRITRVGYYLRKYKLDELPQLINVLIGEMSFVGPRPEVEKYVKLYNNEQQKVLSVKPGITDWASIRYVNESELLARSSEPEKTYINEIMPAKLAINLEYVKQNNLLIDIKIILHTFKAILR
jgi:lipopolysaccharide/colanic/teichoic acid biosynthesis glycosyltransferase